MERATFLRVLETGSPDDYTTQRGHLAVDQGISLLQRSQVLPLEFLWSEVAHLGCFRTREI